MLTREKAVVTGVALPERCCGATAELGTVMSLLALLVKKKKGRHSESSRLVPFDQSKPSLSSIPDIHAVGDSLCVALWVFRLMYVFGAIIIQTFTERELEPTT